MVEELLDNTNMTPKNEKELSEKLLSIIGTPDNPTITPESILLYHKTMLEFFLENHKPDCDPREITLIKASLEIINAEVGTPEEKMSKLNELHLLKKQGDRVEEMKREGERRALKEMTGRHKVREGNNRKKSNGRKK
jgi:hypothetical protein